MLMKLKYIHTFGFHYILIKFWTFRSFQVLDDAYSTKSEAAMGKLQNVDMKA